MIETVIADFMSIPGLEVRKCCAICAAWLYFPALQVMTAEVPNPICQWSRGSAPASCSYVEFD